MLWHQNTLRLQAMPRGFHLITSSVLHAIPEIKRVRIGLLHVFIQHTSASLTINENADPDVRADFETSFNRMVPENQPFIHTIEGPDDMPAHIKASMLGASVSIPVRNGALALGVWQGVYLCEHRDQATPRTLIITLMGGVGE
jgi:secondary thiamine-phosphate synthase enzyme